MNSPNTSVRLRLLTIASPQGDLIALGSHVDDGTADIRAQILELLADHRHQQLQPVVVHQFRATLLVHP